MNDLYNVRCNLHLDPVALNDVAPKFDYDNMWIEVGNHMTMDQAKETTLMLAALFPQYSFCVAHDDLITVIQ